MKRIIVMGATSGIGLAVARRLAERGHRVGLAGRRTEALRQLHEQFPENTEFESIDVTNPDATRLLRVLIDRLGGMDTYFHVAGIGYENTALDPEKELSTLETNVVGFARMIDYAFRYFRDECGGRGHIAAVTSVAGTNGIGRLASYSASKCFGQCYLRALEQLARIEKLKIRFTDIRPGWVRTPLLLDDRDYPMTLQVDEVARLITRAIRRQRRVSVIDWRWNIVVGLWRLMPNCVWVRLPIKVDSIASPAESRQHAAELRSNRP